MMIPLMERKLLLICVGVEGVLLKIAMVPDISELTHKMATISPLASSLKQCCGNREVARKQTGVYKYTV